MRVDRGPREHRLTDVAAVVSEDVTHCRRSGTLPHAEWIALWGRCSERSASGLASAQ
jgi:hypothetical protein